MQHPSRTLADITNSVHGRCNVMVTRALGKDERVDNHNQSYSSINTNNNITRNSSNGNNDNVNVTRNNYDKTNVHTNYIDPVLSVQEVSMSPIISCENDIELAIDDINDDCVELISVAFKHNKIKRFRCIGQHNQHCFKVGQFVIVPGDRGEDCGEIVSVYFPQQNGFYEFGFTHMYTRQNDFNMNMSMPIATSEHIYSKDSVQEEHECRFHPQHKVRTKCWQQHQQREEQEETELQIPMCQECDREIDNYEEVIRVASYEDVQCLFNDISRQERVALHVCRHLVARFALNMIIIDCEYQFDLRKITFFFVANKKVVFNCLSKELYRIFHARIWFENLSHSSSLLPPFAHYIQRQRY